MAKDKLAKPDDICADCGKPRDAGGYHFESATGWGAALHHFKPKAAQPQEPPRCVRCRGTGEISVGTMPHDEACPQCGGAGVITQEEIADSLGQQLTHAMNCPALTPGEDCLCGLKWRVRLQTLQTIHAAWVKRTNEAERELAQVRAELAEAQSNVAGYRSDICLPAPPEKEEE